MHKIKIRQIIKEKHKHLFSLTAFFFFPQLIPVWDDDDNEV